MSKNILIIDDDKHVRYAFVLTLSEKGYVVRTVESGEKALEELSNNNDYDLIFLDLKMTGMDGIETLKNIRDINNEVPVYLVTAFKEEYFSKLKEIEFLELKFELLTKPIDRKEILLITEKVFGELKV